MNQGGLTSADEYSWVVGSLFEVFSGLIVLSAASVTLAFVAPNQIHAVTPRLTEVRALLTLVDVWK